MDKVPKSYKAFLKLMVHVATIDIGQINFKSDEELKLLLYTRGAMQNEIGSPEGVAILKKYNIYCEYNELEEV